MNKFFNSRLKQNFSIILLFFSINILIIFGFLFFNFYSFYKDGNFVKVSINEIVEKISQNKPTEEINNEIKDADAFYFILDQQGF